jgi:hypothetical protein
MLGASKQLFVPGIGVEPEALNVFNMPGFLYYNFFP